MYKTMYNGPKEKHTMPKNLIFIRHGESQANEKYEKIKDLLHATDDDVTYPDREWGLTQKGIYQAKRLGRFLNKNFNINFTNFYVSPYLRARQTAAYLNLYNAKWQPRRELRERSWGDIDSIPTAEFKKNYPKNYSLHEQDPMYWMPPGGESLASVAEGRLLSFFSDLKFELPNNANVLCVCHHDIMLCAKIILEHLTDDSFIKAYNSNKLNLPNASALCFSRRDPNNGSLNDSICFVRVIYFEDDGTLISTPWSEINKPKYSNEQLLESELL